MAQMETHGNMALGNTKPEPTKRTRITPSKYWCFTLNNWTEAQMAQILQCDKINNYIIGKEIGPTNGIPHLQGYIEFKDKIRPLEYIKIKEIHWEKKKGTAVQCIKYCAKDGKWESSWDPRYVNDCMSDKPAKEAKADIETIPDEDLRPWQRDILGIVLGPRDKRTIHWYYENDGNVGKTTFCKYLSLKHKAIPLEGKKNDIFNIAEKNDSNIYLFDFERCMEEYVPYGAMEKIKNGYYMSGKYEGGIVVRNCPHVIVFANFHPDVYKLSLDRWNIQKIGEGKCNCHQCRVVDIAPPAPPGAQP